MSIIAIRSVNLSAESTNAWKEAGVYFARRGRTPERVFAMGYAHILNLGKSSFTLTPEQKERVILWNDGPDIAPLLRPGTTRELLGEYLPPQPTEFPADVWIKAPGAHGRGKFKKQVDRELVLPAEWDWQADIQGQEYRVLTVGHKVVQNLKRHGDNTNRSYEWTPIGEVPAKVKSIARASARLVPGRNVIAWDLIQTPDDETYLFEGNTCPGMSTATATRIRNQMEAQEHAN